MAGNAAKTLIAAKNLDVGVANSGKPDADQRPPPPQPGQRFLDSPQLSFGNFEGQHDLSLIFFPATLQFSR